MARGDVLTVTMTIPNTPGAAEAVVAEKEPDLDLDLDLSPYFGRVQEAETIRLVGTVRRATGMVIESAGPPASLGEVCEVVSGRRQFQVEVVGFREQRVISMPVGRMVGIQAGDHIVSRGRFAKVPAGPELLGRVIDASGEPLDERGALRCRLRRSLTSEPVNPLERDCDVDVQAHGVS